MSTEFELIIQKHLIDAGDLANLADTLMEKARQQEYSDNEVLALGDFFFRAGLYSKLLELCTWQLETDRPVSWEYLGVVLSYQSTVNEELLDLVYEGAKEKGQLDRLASFKNLDSKFPELGVIREKKRSQYYALYEDQKRQILDQIEIARTQNMIAEEKRLVDRLIRLFPGENLGQDQKLLFQERWAREVIGRNRHEASTKRMDEDTHSLTKDQVEMVNIILDQALQYQKEDERLARDFPTLFLMFEAYEQAHELLKAQSPSLASDWLRVEVLLKLRRFVEAISLIQELELRYAGDPETAFSAAYLKAQALWGLSKREQALEIMESLVAARPTYRSAHSYLNLWKRPDR